MLQEVKLEDMLLARERRAFRQQKLIKVCGLPIIFYVEYSRPNQGFTSDSPVLYMRKEDSAFRTRHCWTYRGSEKRGAFLYRL